jgi:hypothetical protein
MASKLTQWINASLKNKGMTAKEAKKNAGKYKSIAAAKRAGSLYYKDKNGKIMIAAYAEDLKKIPKVKPKGERKDGLLSKSGNPTQGPGNRGMREKSITKTSIADKRSKADRPGKGSDEAITYKGKNPTATITGPGTGDEFGFKTKVARAAPKPKNGSSPKPKKSSNKDKKLKKNKGGPVTKKKKGYAAGGLKATSANQVGLKKLPKDVRNKMGYMSKGGMTTKRKR